MKMRLKKEWRKLGMLMAVVMMMSACSPSEKTEGTRESYSETETERVEGQLGTFNEESSETEQNQLETGPSQAETEQNQAETEPDQPETEDTPEPEKPVYQPAIGQLGEQVEYLDAAELALHGMTSVTTDYLTIDPVNNVSYVVCEGYVEIYYCGVYCGYFTDAYYGKAAWTGDGRDEINRVFGGAREWTVPLDWDVVTVNPYLKMVCSYNAESLGDSMADFQEWGVYENASEWYGRDLFGWGALFGVEKAECGYVLWLSRGIVNKTLANDLMLAIKFNKESFTQAARDAMDSFATKAEHAYAISASDLEALAKEGKLTLKITDGDFTYVVPKPYVAIEEGEDCWGIYQFVRLIGAQKIGQVSIRDVADETAGVKERQRAVFNDEQRERFVGNAAQEKMTDDFCWLSTTTILSDDGQRVMEIERLQFGDAEYAPEGWQDAAWAEFEDYTPVEWDNIKINKYSGFLDRLVVTGGEGGWERIRKSYPSGDYDLDGRTDRLYARPGTKRYCDIYLFLSGGGVILLQEYDYISYTVQYSLEGYDWDGDFRPEISCAIYHDGGTGFPSYSFQIFDQPGPDYSGVRWTAMELPGKDLTVKAQIVDDNHLKVIQPDYSVGAIYEVHADMIDQMWYGEADRSLAIDWELAEGLSMFWTDPDTGKRLIRTEWNIEVSKWYCQCAAIGQWVYEDGSWKLRDLLPGGFDTWGMSHYLNVEKTESSLKDGKTLSDILGWQPKTEFESGENVSLWITSIGGVHINNLIKDATISGTCEIKDVSDLATDRVKLRELSLAEALYAADMSLYRTVEDDQIWLVMEYDGEKLYFEDRWNEGMDVEWLEVNTPEVTGSMPFYIEELDVTLNIPETLYVYRTPGIYKDWQGKTSVLDCARWILITDKEYTENYLTGGLAENLREETEHFVYRIELVSRELYPVWNLCAFNETDKLYLTEDGYCRYYDSGYAVRRINGDGTEEIWHPGEEWTEALMGKVEPIIGGYARWTFILTPGFGQEDDLESKYRYTMVNDIWWQNYTRAVDALLSDPEGYSYPEEVISELTDLVRADYGKYVEKYGSEEEPELIGVYMDSAEDIYLRAQEYARCAAFYAERAIDKNWSPENLKERFVVFLEWDNGQRSFALYTYADLGYQLDFPEAKYQKVGGTYDYMVDLQAAYDYMRRHMESE